MADNSTEQVILQELLGDRRRDRRWKMIRFVVYVLILLAYLLVLIGAFSGKSSGTSNEPYVSLVRMNGVIMPNQAFSARRIVPRLEKAFADKHAKGVILVINSPGGSPVQASIIHDKIEQLKKEYHKKVVVVGEDMLTSGAYLVASAADKIYVNQDTITGSIGVIMNGFGFVDTLKKLGISRRVYTAGIHKDRLDPFAPLKAGDIKKIKILLNRVHQHFIADVKAGRKGKLVHNKDLFTGDFWTGDEAVKLGLADGTEDLWTVMETQFHVKHYKDYSAQPSLLNQLVKGAETRAAVSLGLTNHSTPVQEVM